MSNIKELAGLPDLNFIENKTQQDFRDEMVNDYISFMKNAGQPAELPEAHPDRLIIYATANKINQLAQYIDSGAKMNFLKYAEGEALDNLAAFKKIERLQARPATTTLKFTLSAEQGGAVGIPSGTRVKTDSGVYFSTDTYTEVPAGELTATVTATALTAGTGSNGVALGEVKTMVDPVGYVAAVENTTISAGGSNIETDDELTLRVYNAPPAWSVAGPLSAYDYWALQARADIETVKSYSPEGKATEVFVVFTLDGGVMPDEAACKAMEEFLFNKDIRPATDKVTAMAPTEVEYNIDLKYYISESDEAKAMTIQAAVEAALQDYIKWQRVIGRDINPSKIYQFLMTAGARRIELTSPTMTEVEDYSLPKAASVSCVYGGVEID